MSDALVTIAASSNAVKIDLLKIRLESEGIECFVADDHIGVIQPFYGYLAGGIKLQVRASDLRRAAAVLQRPPAGAEPVEDVTAAAAEEEDQLRCPMCKSADVRRKRHSLLLVLGFLFLLGIPFLYLDRQWSCRECGHQWKAK